ncbi:MAG: hypothetical protein WAV09_02950 [Minisyncoccia bacterium]
MKFPASVVMFPGRMFGYNLRFITNPERRAAFMQALKSSLPMKMWDGGSFVWWVPELYCAIIETLGLEHGALTQGDLERVRGQRFKYNDPELTLAGDLKTLGLLPDAPYRLIEMAAAYWKSTLTSIPIALLDLQEKEAAWARIQEHYRQVGIKMAPVAPLEDPVPR